MTTFWQAIIGAAMIVIGGIKTWLHMGSIPLLSLPTCNGETINIALGNASWLERAHCWGCYMLAAGLIIVALAAFDQVAKRRSVAS
ncbi:MAG: hypothetical protein HRT82_07660 [Henriciella sp.]|nr:hypothetical protein [Henriciella sp.]